jgi:RHS repeat-associated protein
MTNAALSGAPAQSYVLTYDEDNRTTSILWTTNAQMTTVSNRYDALGRRVSRRLNGTNTNYVLDLSGTMERILCDLDGAGTITAWYVHGPDLAFKVSADGALTCYHADAQANIIALSGTNGTLLAQYAFTPYGRLLGSTNLQPATFNQQPFTFVGSQGVMEELPGLYFMRARYYSAEAGVFLSSDPVKKIGAGWKPIAFNYTSGNLNGLGIPPWKRKRRRV